MSWKFVSDEGWENLSQSFNSLKFFKEDTSFSSNVIFQISYNQLIWLNIWNVKGKILLSIINEFYTFSLKIKYLTTWEFWYFFRENLFRGKYICIEEIPRFKPSLKKEI